MHLHTICKSSISNWPCQVHSTKKEWLETKTMSATAEF